MKISELISQLKSAQDAYGDIKVLIYGRIEDMNEITVGCVPLVASEEPCGESDKVESIALL